jgi:hypothetical protein
MTRRRVVIALWCACLFAVWNVIFDFHVWTSATDFTRQQVTLHQSGQPGLSLHDGFSPRVSDAAVRATLYTLPLLAVGAISIYLSFRRVR